MSFTFIAKIYLPMDKDINCKQKSIHSLSFFLSLSLSLSLKKNIRYAWKVDLYTYCYTYIFFRFI